MWAEVATKLLRGLRALLEGLLEEERTAHVGAARHERVRDRRGHRNGHYTRASVTTYGPLPKLRVPWLLEGGIGFTLFNKYQRRQAAVDAAIGQLFLQGITTRRLKAIAQALFGAPVSAGTVSETAAVLDADLQAYQTKPLTDDVVFLFLDGISQRVRKLSVEGKVMLCAFGIHADGTKALLSFRLADVEDTVSWRGFLVDLKNRGLKGTALTLLTVDGHPALLKALRGGSPLRRIQRCLAHKLRNVVVKLKRAQREACMGEAKLIFGAPSRTRGHPPVPGLAREVARRGRSGGPLSGEGPVPLFPLLQLPAGSLENRPHHQHPGTGVPGGASPDAAHRRVHQRRVSGTDHVRRDRASQRELAGAPPSTNSTACLTLPEVDSRTVGELVRVALRTDRCPFRVQTV